MRVSRFTSDEEIDNYLLYLFSSSHGNMTKEEAKKCKKDLQEQRDKRRKFWETSEKIGKCFPR